MAHGMSTDTKWIVGTGAAIILSVVGTGVALGGLLSVQFAAINARFDDLRADLTAEIAALKADLSGEIAVVRDGGGRVHGEKRERRGKHAYRARRPPSSRA
jgi:hypothetical protein